MAGTHLACQLSLSRALMRSWVVKMWGLRRKQQSQCIKGHLGSILLQMVRATDQREKRDDVGSCVNIRMVVTRVQLDQHCFAKHMGVASDVNIRMVATRVLGDQHCFAKHMGAASDVNFQTVVARVLGAQQCFALRTVEGIDVNIWMVATRGLMGQQCFV
jgi:hypothetical protein